MIFILILIGLGLCCGSEGMGAILAIILLFCFIGILFVFGGVLLFN